MPEPQPELAGDDVEPYFQLPGADDTAISTSVPDDMPPPAAPAVGEEPQEGDLDARALRALSRQERKDAKAALRREQKEAREAARQARAAAKIAAKTGQPVSTEPLLPPEDESDAAPALDTEPADAAATAAAEVAEVADVADAPAEETTQPIAAVTDTDSDPAAPSAATDPRSRAAQRVQRRLGKDEEKTSAAEARARAREEARRRRAQAKELRSGVAVEEPVIREPDADPLEDADLAEAIVDAPALEETVPEETVLEEPGLEEPGLEEPELDAGPDETALIEPVVDEPEPEPEAESTAVSEPVVDEAAADADDVVVEDSVESMPPPTLNAPDPDVSTEPAAATTTTWEPAHRDTGTDAETDTESDGRSPVGPIAGALGLVCLAISVLLAVGALLVALGVDSGMFYNALETVANALVGPLKNAFDFGGANAERKEHFIAWGAGSIVYLVLSFAGQAVQRANTEE